MKNEVYEADYTREPEPDSSIDILDIARETGFFKMYNDIMQSVPKVIVPKDKQNYEELLQKLDAFVKLKGGKIRGVVDYEHWDSHIYVTLPFFEFVHKDEFELLAELGSKSNILTFTPTDDGKIQLTVMINYFDEIGDKDEVFGQAIDGNDELIAALMSSIERRKQAILEHPVVGKLVEGAAANLGISPEEYIDRAFEDDGSDPELQMQLIAALLEAKDDIFDGDE